MAILDRRPPPCVMKSQVGTKGWSLQPNKGMPSDIKAAAPLRRVTHWGFKRGLQSRDRHRARELILFPRGFNETINFRFRYTNQKPQFGTTFLQHLDSHKRTQPYRGRIVYRRRCSHIGCQTDHIRMENRSYGEQFRYADVYHLSRVPCEVSLIRTEPKFRYNILDCSRISSEKLIRIK